MQSAVFLLFSLFSITIQADKVSVNGTFMCRGKSAGNVLVQLYDQGVVSDKELSEIKTLRNGHFELRGEADNFKPLLWVQHMCRVSQKGCWRQFGLPIPQDYVNSKNTYQMTFIAMDISWQGEEEKCK